MNKINNISKIIKFESEDKRRKKGVTSMSFEIEPELKVELETEFEVVPEAEPKPESEPGGFFNYS